MNAQRRLSSRKPSVQPHAVDRHHRPAGFTLVELLVVITIIGILAGIAVPAIFSAVSTAKSTAMKMELNSLETAVQKYQEKYGDYPPDFSDWAVVERHYRKIFPRISNTPPTPADPFGGDLWRLQAALTSAPDEPPRLDRGEVLTFVLGGYSSNPIRPFTGPGGPWEYIQASGQFQVNTSRENSLFDFSPAQVDLKLLDETQPFSTANYYVSGDGDLFLSYAASTKNETPFVYFDSRTYDDHNPDKGFNGYTTLNGETGSVRPYLSDIQQTNGGWQFMKPDSFQIIAPGIDGNFGWLSQEHGPNSGDKFTAVYFQYPTGKAVTFDIRTNPITRVLRSDVNRYQEPVPALPKQINVIDNAQQDNLTNFADGKLIDELQE